MFKKRYLLMAMLILFFASSAFAGGGAPANPYRGTNNVSETTLPSAIEQYYWDNLPQAAKDYDMPTFTRPGWSSSVRGSSVYGRMTAHEDMIEYLEALPKENMQMRFVAEILTYNTSASTPENLGMPVRSFPYPLCVFTREGVFGPEEVKALGKPVLLFEGSIHGNESAAMEGMMHLAKRLADPTHVETLNPLLDKVSVVIIPRYNVDGNWKNIRESDTLQAWHYTSTAAADAKSNSFSRINGLDLNRDQTGFESPITRLVNQIWNAYEPYLIGDGHQQGISTGTSAWNNGIAILFTSNPNTPEELDVLAYDGITAKSDYNDSSTWANVDSLEWIAKRAARAEGRDTMPYVGTGSNVSRATTQPNPYEFYTGSTWSNPANYTLVRNSFQEGNPEEGITDTAGRLMGGFGVLCEISSPGQGQIGVAYHNRIRSYETFCASMIEAFADPVRGPILKAGVDNARKAMAEGTSVRPGLTTHEGDFVISIKNTNPQHLSHEYGVPGEGIPTLRLVRNPELTAGDPGWNTPVVRKDFIESWIHRSRYVSAQDYRNSAHTALDYSVVKRPTAYILHGPDAEAIVKAAERVAYTGVKIERLAEAVTIPVEFYTVTGFGQSFQYFRGSEFPTGVPQLSVGITGASKGEKVVEFPKDSVVIYTNQYKSPHAALTLEPAGARNFGNYWYSRAFSKKDGFLPVALNQDFPVYRFMGDASELNTYFAGDVKMLPFVSGTHIEFPLLLTQEEKAEFTDSIARGPLLAFSSFKVNMLAEDFEAYLKKTQRPGAWYAWNWAEGRAEVITAGENEYAKLTVDNIGPDNKVILFKAQAFEVVADAKVEKLNGNQNKLTIFVTELYNDHEVEYVPVTFMINNNAAGTYKVGPYNVYVDTKGNTQIRECKVLGFVE
ncbi:MAG: hypothetical protein FWF87_04770 [Synergistaceae bacterium]|nr:hypothetical protein [Synergistaceae bacterium]